MVINETFKKYVKRQDVNKEIERAVVTMGISELQ